MRPEISDIKSKCLRWAFFQAFQSKTLYRITSFEMLNEIPPTDDLITYFVDNFMPNSKVLTMFSESFYILRANGEIYLNFCGSLIYIVVLIHEKEFTYATHPSVFERKLTLCQRLILCLSRRIIFKYPFQEV